MPAIKAVKTIFTMVKTIFQREVSFNTVDITVEINVLNHGDFSSLG